MSQAGSTGSGGGGGGGGLLRYILANANPFAAQPSDDAVGVDTTTEATTVELPDAPSTGKYFIIKDIIGNASVNNITVTTVSGTVLIDGATTLVMNSDFESVQFLFDGTQYLPF